MRQERPVYWQQEEARRTGERNRYCFLPKGGAMSEKEQTETTAEAQHPDLEDLAAHTVELSEEEAARAAGGDYYMVNPRGSNQGSRGGP
jgi:hypothetical protein